jgi:glutathione synthase/RimK-type ligase-like ATP-grasp enzyme
MTILILGEEYDNEVASLLGHLSPNAETVLLDSDAVMNGLSWSESVEEDTMPMYLNLYGTKYKASNIHAVFWRSNSFSGQIGMVHTDERNRIACLHSIARVLSNSLWLNPIRSYEEHINKPSQLKVVSANGLKVPNTLITSDVAALDEFLGLYREIILKPVSGGDYARKITHKTRHFLSGRKDILPHVYTVQEYIAGRCLRTFVIGRSVFGVWIDSDMPDYRIDPSAKISGTKISQDLYEKCMVVLRILGMNWTAIDWIVSHGEPVFLEANFSPMFSQFEKETGYPLSRSIANVLLEGCL